MCSLAPSTIARRIQRGFTLVELLIVVIILAVLSSIVIPQFSSSTTEAKEAALTANLSVMRSAIELYRAQHGGKNPGESTAVSATGQCTSGTAIADGTAADDTERAKAMRYQLTLYSNINGETCNGVQGANAKYGPYLRSGIPQDPIKDTVATGVKAVAKAGVLVVADVDSSTSIGWLYNPTTGEIRHNSTAYIAR